MNKFISFLMWALTWLGLDPKKAKGKTRSVIILSSLGVVIKIPIFIPKVYVKVASDAVWDSFSKSKSISDFLTLALTNDYSARRYVWKTYVTAGIEANIREFIFWNKHRGENFLVPTYFSFFGLINIMPLGESILTHPGLMCLWGRLTNDQCREDDHHFVNNRNFVVFEGRLCSCDYGNVLTQTVLERHFESFRGLPPFTTLEDFQELQINKE